MDFKLKDGDVLIGICDNNEMEKGRLEVVTNIYKNQGYLKDIPNYFLKNDINKLIQNNGFDFIKELLSPDQFISFLHDGMLFFLPDKKQYYIDKFFWQSINFYAKTNQCFVGSLRLILSNQIYSHAVFDLPTKSTFDLNMDSEFSQRIMRVKAELSQLAKEKFSPSNTMVALLRAAVQYSFSNSINEWIAITDNKVLRLLNSNYFNFGLPIIDNSIYYLGSESSPILIDIEASLKSAANKKSSQDVAKYIRGENLPSFQNYFFA